jgi:hypothetical protein
MIRQRVNGCLRFFGARIKRDGLAAAPNPMNFRRRIRPPPRRVVRPMISVLRRHLTRKTLRVGRRLPRRAARGGLLAGGARLVCGVGSLCPGGVRLGHWPLWPVGLPSDPAHLSVMVHFRDIGRHHLSFSAERIFHRVSPRDTQQVRDCRNEPWRRPSDGCRFGRMVRCLAALAAFRGSHSQRGRLGHGQRSGPERHRGQMVRTRSVAVGVREVAMLRGRYRGICKVGFMDWGE